MVVVNTNVNPESILIVSFKGVLIRLQCPFKARSLVQDDFTQLDKEYTITHVISNSDGILYYGVKYVPLFLCYNRFEILLDYSH